MQSVKWCSVNEQTLELPSARSTRKSQWTAARLLNDEMINDHHSVINDRAAVLPTLISIGVIIKYACTHARPRTKGAVISRRADASGNISNIRDGGKFRLIPQGIRFAANIAGAGKAEGENRRQRARSADFPPFAKLVKEF